MLNESRKLEEVNSYFLLHTKMSRSQLLDSDHSAAAPWDLWTRPSWRPEGIYFICFCRLLYLK